MEVDKNGNITKLFGQPSSTQTKVSLSGALGYNNGVLLLNDICQKRYGNSYFNTYARGITIEDIEENMSVSGLETARNNHKNSINYQYGMTKKYTNNVKYPIIYANEKYSGINVSSVPDETQIIISDSIYKSKMNPDGKNQSENIYNSVQSSNAIGTNANVLTVTNTLWYGTQTSSYFNDDNFFKLIYESGTTYWLASRYAYCNQEAAGFGIRAVGGNSLGNSGLDLFSSFGYSQAGSRCLAPVIIFNSTVKITSGSGVESNPYILEK